jgi:hypothetical protein
MYAVYIYGSGQPYIRTYDMVLMNLANPSHAAEGSHSHMTGAKAVMCRVGQNHIYTVYIRYFGQGNHQIYGHIRCVYTVLANPSNVSSDSCSATIRTKLLQENKFNTWLGQKRWCVLWFFCSVTIQTKHLQENKFSIDTSVFTKDKTSLQRCLAQVISRVNLSLSLSLTHTHTHARTHTHSHTHHASTLLVHLAQQVVLRQRGSWEAAAYVQERGEAALHHT